MPPTAGEVWALVRALPALPGPLVDQVQDIFGDDAEDGYAALIVLQRAYPHPSMGDVSVLTDPEIVQLVPVGEVITLVPAVVAVAAADATPDVPAREAAPAIQRTVTLGLCGRLRRLRDSCHGIMHPPLAAPPAAPAAARAMDGTAMAAAIVQGLQGQGTADARAFTVQCPALPAGFETVPSLSQPPKKVLQGWEQKCHDHASGRNRSAPYFPGEIELTRDMLPTWAPRELLKASDAKRERDRAKARYDSSPYVSDSSVLHDTSSYMMDEENCGGFPLFCVMLWRWGLAVASLRVEDQEALSASQTARQALYPARGAGCEACQVGGPPPNSRASRFFDVAEFFMYFGNVCKVATTYTSTHAIEYDRRVRYAWGLRVSQGEVLDWRKECEDINVPERDATLAARPFLLPQKRPATAMESPASLVTPPQKRGKGLEQDWKAPPPPPAQPPRGKGKEKGYPKGAKPSAPPPPPRQGKGLCWYQQTYGTCTTPNCAWQHPPGDGTAHMVQRPWGPRAGKGLDKAGKI